MTDDGERIFFTSYDALVPGDTNGSTDVYEWHDGAVDLISGGTGSAHSTLIGTTPTGDDVFFTTDEKLVGWDGDFNSDIYDARVGGGFPEPPPVPEGCAVQADGCQGPGSSPGSVSESTSNGAGSGNVDGGVRAGLSLRRLSAAQLAWLGSGHRVSLEVGVNRAGRVSASGVARVAGKRRRVVSGSAVARRAGTVRVPLRLSKAARRHVADGRRLALTLRVGLSGAQRRLTMGLTVKPTAGQSKRRTGSGRGGAR
jgi:hypothetical protein